MEEGTTQAIPRWLQALLGLASLCVVGLTIAGIVVFAVAAPQVADEASDRIDERIEEALDDLQESIETALEPTNEEVRHLDSSLGDELRELLDRIQQVEDWLTEIRDLLDEINLRDAEALELRLE